MWHRKASGSIREEKSTEKKREMKKIACHECHADGLPKCLCAYIWQEQIEWENETEKKTESH